MSASPAARLVRMFAPLAPTSAPGDRPVNSEPSRPTLVGRQPTPISDLATALSTAARLLVLWGQTDAHLARNPHEKLGYRHAIKALRHRAEDLRDHAAQAVTR